MPVNPPDSYPLIAERLLQVIDEGRRTATYKLALLMALIDACATNSDAAGRVTSLPARSRLPARGRVDAQAPGLCCRLARVGLAG